MQAIILAAGTGSRLGREVPKSLVEISNHYCFLDHQLHCLEILNSRHNITVNIVVGYKAYLFHRYEKKIRAINNPYFDITNTAHSLFLAMKYLSNYAEDFLIIEGDVYFDEGGLDELLDKQQSGIATRSTACGKEEMKFVNDKDNFLRNISKELKDHDGEAMGIAKINAQMLEEFFRFLSETPPMEYWEFALQRLIQTHDIRTVDISKFNCIEVDFPEDLKLLLDQRASSA
jgi:choline kinase